MGRLEGVVRADAAIIGGSLAGLLLGAALADSGLRVAVVNAADADAHSDCRTASILCAGAFNRIAAAQGLSAARQYADELQTQLHTLLDAPPSYVRPAPIYAYARTSADLPELKHQQELYTQLLIPVSIAPDAGGCPFPVELSLTAQGAVVDIEQWKAALYSSILRRGGRIFTDSPVFSLEGTRAHTLRGCVEAPHIILMTGKPLGLQDRRLLPLLESRLIAHCRLTSLFPLHSCQQAVDESGLSLTAANHGIVASWETGRLGTRAQQVRFEEFEDVLHRRLPDWQQGEMYCSQRIRPADGLPFIGALPGTGLMFASGFCGIPGAMHAAEVLARRIRGNALPEDALYSPDRKIPRRIRRQEFRRCAALFAQNMLRISAPECAHCGCRMRYVMRLRHWTCAVCGTAYDMFGQVVSGPGMRPAQVSIRQRPDI